MATFSTDKSLVSIVSDRCGISRKNVRAILSSAIDYITDELMYGECIELRGLGVFRQTERASRKGRNIHTGDPIHIPACRVVRFHVSRAVARRVRNVT